MLETKIEIVVATRYSEQDFWTQSALGKSLMRFSFDTRIQYRVTHSNFLGLPSIYNSAISVTSDETILVFIHDDVWLDDYYLVDRIVSGLQQFDVIGLAGNVTRSEAQPSWRYLFIDGKPIWDDLENCSGRIGLGIPPLSQVINWGIVPAKCELLDGVFLATKATTLKQNNIFFDERFDFHFYDMDFCRSVRAKNLSLGTWPICVTHESDGVLFSEPWYKNYHLYIQKWGS